MKKAKHWTIKYARLHAVLIAAFFIYAIWMAMIAQYGQVAWGCMCALYSLYTIIHLRDLRRDDGVWAGMIERVNEMYDRAIAAYGEAHGRLEQVNRIIEWADDMGFELPEDVRL